MGNTDRRLRLLATLAGILGIAAAVLSGFAGNWWRNATAGNALAGGVHLWLADNHGLIQIDAQGKLQREVSFDALGIDAASELHALDATRLLIAEPGSARLKVLDTTSGKAAGEIRLSAQPPRGTLRLASRPLKQGFEIAAAFDGRLQSFDETGQPQGQSKAGEVKAAESVLFDGEAWWVADSARQQLTQLQPGTLATTDNVPLSALNALRVPGIARASHGNESERDKPVIATLIRHHPDKAQARVVDVFSDATEAEFPLPAGSQPLDIAWLGKELWVLDGAQGALWRFDAARKLLGKLDEPAISGRLSGSAFWRSFAEAIASASRIAAIICLSLAALCAIWLLRGWVKAQVMRRLRPPPEVSDEEDWEARR